MIEINALLSSLHIDVATLAVGVLSAILTQGAKKVSFIPLSEGQTKALRITAGVLTFGGTFITAWLSGDLTSAGFTQYLNVIAQSVVAYFFAFLTYKSALNDPNANNKGDEEVAPTDEDELLG